jgi:hypothetical protein
MSLLIGGGALKLETETFENEEPTGLLVQNFLAFEVQDPIPAPVDPGPNEVKSLEFRKVAAYGIKLANGLKEFGRNSFYSKDIILYRRTQGTIKFRSSNKWVSVQIRRWNGASWVPSEFSIWNGKDWIQ